MNRQINFKISETKVIKIIILEKNNIIIISLELTHLYTER